MLLIVHTILQFSVPTAIQIVCIMNEQTCFQKTCQHWLGSLHVLKALPLFLQDVALRLHMCSFSKISNGILLFYA